MNPMVKRLSLLAAVAGALALAAAGPAAAQAKKLGSVSMTMSWFPQAEHGGFFAAKAEGIYDKYGLDVTLKPGGPQVNAQQLLAAGQSDFIMGSTMRAFNARIQGVPIVTVFASFQKDPQSLIVHEGAGMDTLEAVKGKPLMMPGTARLNYWPWLKTKYGFGDEQLRPYDGSLRALSVDKTAASQGYVTNDGYLLNKIGMKGRSLVLADFGWGAYVGTIDTTDRLVKEKPEVVRAFVRATSEGWMRYLANPAAAHALIRQMNPQMEPELMAFAYNEIRTKGYVDSGDAKGGKAGMLSEARLDRFAKEMMAAGALPAGFDWKPSHDLQFVKGL